MQSTTSTVCLLEEGTTRSDAVVGNKLKNGEITLALSAIPSICAVNSTNSGTATSIGTGTGAGASVCVETTKTGDALPDARADAAANGTSGDIVSADDSSDIDGMTEEMTRYRPRSPGGRPTATRPPAGSQANVKPLPTTQSGPSSTKKPRPPAVTLTSPTTAGQPKVK
ncbi:hypothetical protein BGW80DRAFT_224321 [Lactifluus volemus]|nr:hypothetical protein BGW80DRAFT_224321 [Lactifluus volemus]